jgi:ABC-type branched-subunit amino acid transport system substrate-binding protein
MMPNLELHRAARRSWAAVVLTAVLITINHRYALGPKAFGLGAVLIVAPTLLLWWFKRTRSNVAFGGYVLMNLWVVIGFGVFKGLWKSTLPVFAGTLLSALSTSYPRPTLAPVWMEVGGVAMFMGSAFVAAFAYQLVRTRWGPARASVLPASAGVLAFGVIVAAYVVTDRDRWVAPSNGIVKIGVIVPTGGPYAVLGNSFLKAVQMAQSDLRGTKYRYQLVLVDVGQDPYQARAAIQQAIQDERVSAIVGGISRFGQVTRPLATAARILHTCVCSVTSIGDGAYNFTNIPSPEAEGVRWVQEAQRRRIRNIALLTQDYPSIQGHVDALKVEIRRAGLTITDAQEFADSVTDFRKIIARAQVSHPDVYYVEALNPQLDELAQQLADAKIRNIASVVAPSVSQRPDLFEATWYTDSNLRDVAFKTRFERLYPGTQFATHMMPYAYDDFNMIVQAFERGQNPAVYVRNIATYEGNAGTLTKGQGSGNFQSTPAVWAIEHGKPVLLSHQ